MLEKNKLYQMDCKEGIELLEDNTIDLVLTSPPYYNAREYSQWGSYGEYLSEMTLIFDKLYPKLKEGRMLVINISPVIEPRLSRNHESKRYAIPFHLVNILENIGYKFLEDIIWEKPNPSVKNRNGGFFRNRKPVAYKPNIVHEYILVFQKPSKHLIDKVLKDNQDKVRDSLVLGDYEKTSIWKISPKKDKIHSAVFPRQLSDNVVKYYSFKGDLVLDIFSGSGTTLISSKELGREYIGFELNEEYYKYAMDNLNKGKER